MSDGVNNTIALDVDNVLADTTASFCALATSKTGTKFEKSAIKSPKIVGSFRADPRWILSLLDEVWSNWESLRPVEIDIASTMGKLRKQKRVMIATSRPSRSIPKVLDWLASNRIEFDEFIKVDGTAGKSKLPANFLIDDDVDQVYDFVTKVETRYGYLFDQPWNRGILPIERVSRISSIKEIL